MKDYSIATEEEIIEAQKASEIKYKKVTPPFGYFGSKNRIALQLCKDLPRHNCWVEAFCGSASLTLAKPPAPIEVINDIDSEIVNVFKQLRENPEKLYKVLELTPYAREEFENAIIKNTTNASELERARIFLIQAMMAINGVFGEAQGGFSYSQSYSRNGRDARVNRWCNLPDRLSKVVSRLRSVRIDNRDAKEIINMFINRPATLVYLDPPYLGDRTKGYTNDLNDENYHQELLELAIQANCMVFISGYENELYSELLTEKKGWSKKTIATITKDSNGKSHDRSEVVWMNSQYKKAIDTDSIPIKLTQKEIKEKKLNPER
ncbi:MAG: DNA adenine methylase [Candidatus Paceibacterota bacterium]